MPPDRGTVSSDLCCALDVDCPLQAPVFEQWVSSYGALGKVVEAVKGGVLLEEVGN